MTLVSDATMTVSIDGAKNCDGCLPWSLDSGESGQFCQDVKSSMTAGGWLGLPEVALPLGVTSARDVIWPQ